MNRVDIIKTILNKRESKTITCDHCNRTYLPMAQSSVDTCPLCGKSHLDIDLANIDLTDESLLGCSDLDLEVYI